MEKLNIEKDINNNVEIAEKQNSFLESKMGNIINKSVNVGLRYLLPDVIENQIIKIKDSLLKGGIQGGIKEAINEGINLGKSSMGIVTGKFENVEQVQMAIKKGGIIDSIEDVLDKTIYNCTQKGLISPSLGEIITKGKNTILNTISNNIENEFEYQLNAIEKIEKYSNNWKDEYLNKNYEGMEKEYKKIAEQMGNIIPLENTIKKARTIENLQKLIKNNGKDFNLTEEEIELANVI